MSTHQMHDRLAVKNKQQHSWKMDASLSSKGHNCSSYYYNYHHFRWKLYQTLQSLEMEGRNGKTLYHSRDNFAKQRDFRHLYKQHHYGKATSDNFLRTMLLVISLFFILTSNQFMYCQGKSNDPTQLLTHTEDSPTQPSKSVTGVPNCFSLQPKKHWSQIITHNASTASVTLNLANMDQAVVECLRGMPLACVKSVLNCKLTKTV